jgi:hypothetical protein
MKTKLMLLMLLTSSFAFSQKVKEVNLLTAKNTTITIENTAMLSVLIYPELSRTGEFSISTIEGQLIIGDAYVEIDFLEIDINELKKGNYMVRFQSEDEEIEHFNLLIK